MRPEGHRQNAGNGTEAGAKRESGRPKGVNEGAQTYKRLFQYGPVMIEIALGRDSLLRAGSSGRGGVVNVGGF